MRIRLFLDIEYPGARTDSHENIIKKHLAKVVTAMARNKVFDNPEHPNLKLDQLGVACFKVDKPSMTIEGQAAALDPANDEPSTQVEAPNPSLPSAPDEGA